MPRILRTERAEVDLIDILRSSGHAPRPGGPSPSRPTSGEDPILAEFPLMGGTAAIWHPDYGAALSSRM